MSKVSITFGEYVGRYAVYHIHLDGVVVANVYGPMAAIATEAVCRYLDEGKETIRVGDFMNRVQAGGDSDDESENCNL